MKVKNVKCIEIIGEKILQLFVTLCSFEQNLSSSSGILLMYFVCDHMTACVFKFFTRRMYISNVECNIEVGQLASEIPMITASRAQWFPWALFLISLSRNH